MKTDKPLVSHEDRVERFYSHGSHIRAHEADGFLSFGYWDQNTREYRDSAENLVRFFLREGKISPPDAILNVACGYGAESIRFFRELKPNVMHCIDITKAHIDFAKSRATELGLQAKLLFEKRDACRTGFPNGMFSHILGIEGPAHFKTRQEFFGECHRLLKKGGELLLTDITFDSKKSRAWLTQKMSKLGARHWHMPKENWIDTDEYVQQLKEAGFKVAQFLKIGDHVFPGFAEYNTRLKSILNAVKTRGLPIGIGLTFISWLLGYGHRKGMIDYVFVKAVKV